MKKVKVYFKQFSRWITTPLFWRQRCIEWNEIADARGYQLSKMRDALKESETAVDYWHGLVKTNDESIEWAYVDMRKLREEIKSLKAQIKMVTT